MTFNPNAKVRSILLIDDEEMVLLALQRAFRSRYRNSPVHTELFTSPFDALRRAKEKTFDAVVTDMKMPDMDGAAFLKSFRLIQPDTPRFLLSARSDFDQLSRAINDGGICHFCQKPWADDHLLGLIESAITLAEENELNKTIANEKKVDKGQLSASDEALRQFEKQHPLLAHVKKDSDGSIIF